MQTPLPSLNQQRLKIFRPSAAEVLLAYDQLNSIVFEQQLIRPNIHIKRLGPLVNGVCYWHFVPTNTGSWCTIQIRDRWPCVQWLYSVLAHEMIHQWQYDGR